jgi:pimeloyl-[acyl-carrier protein] methyl ester esterase
LQFFTASDGARIAYRDEGHGVPLVLLHGLMAHGGFFREQDVLADKFRLIRIDLRGHGASTKDGDRSSVERIAADVAELAAALDLRNAIGVGWSLGATILWHVLTGAAADRFAGAVVVDMTARVLNDEDWDLGLSAEACAARSAAIREDFESFAARCRSGDPSPSRSRTARARSPTGRASSSPATIPPPSPRCGPRWSNRTCAPSSQGIRHPTLIVHGAQSRLYGEDTADHLVAALPDARAVASTAPATRPISSSPNCSTAP